MFKTPRVITSTPNIAAQAAQPPARSQRIFWLVPAALLFVPLFANQYQQYVVNLILVYVPVAVGFNLVMGNLGQLAFSNLAFFSLGAYVSALLSLRYGIPWGVTVAAAGVASGLMGLLVGIAALRGLRAFYLAIVTLALGELMRWSYINIGEFTGGASGLALPAPSFFGWAMKTEATKFYVFLAIAVVVVVSTNRLLRSRIGRALVATRDNELAAAAMGIPTGLIFLITFAWSGFMVGVGGAGYAALIQYVSPEAFGLRELILQFAIVMVGGLGSLTGSVIGAVVVTALPEFLRSFPGFFELLLGTAIVLIILFLPKGLASLLQPKFPTLRYRYTGK